MRVSTNSSTNNMIAELEDLTSQQTHLQTEVSTGLSITEPADDPAAFGSVMNDDTQSRQLTQYRTNATTALSISQSTLSALQQVSTVADRATQIGTLNTGTGGSSSMSSYVPEVNQLIEETVQLGNSQLNNNYLFAGTAVTTSPYAVARDAAGDITGVTYRGNITQAAIPISTSSSVSPGSDGSTNQGLTDFMNQLVAMRDALNAGDSTAVSTAQSGLLTSENSVINEVATQGAVQMRIQVSQAQQISLSQNLASDVSSKTSADLATTEVKLTQAQNAYQAAVQSAASIMQRSILTYLPIA